METHKFLTLVCAAFGVITFISPALGIVRVKTAVLLSLDFWMSAGLIHLSGTLSWTALATAAMLIIIRKLTLLTFAIR